MGMNSCIIRLLPEGAKIKKLKNGWTASGNSNVTEHELIQHLIDRNTEIMVCVEDDRTKYLINKGIEMFVLNDRGYVQLAMLRVCFSWIETGLSEAYDLIAVISQKMPVKDWVNNLWGERVVYRKDFISKHLKRVKDNYSVFKQTYPDSKGERLTEAEFLDYNARKNRIVSTYHRNFSNYKILNSKEKSYITRKKEKPIITAADLIEKIKTEKSTFGVGSEISFWVRKAFPEKRITLYEAFQLMEMSDRLEYANPKCDYFGFDAVKSLNMALLAKLFNEDELYESFCEDAEKRRDYFYNMLKKGNGGKMPDGEENYILADLKGFLKGDKEHLEKLSAVRKKRHLNNDDDNYYHYEFFPKDELIYEDELLKIINREIDHYDIDKTISPEICDVMVAAELHADEVS